MFNFIVQVLRYPNIFHIWLFFLNGGGKIINLKINIHTPDYLLQVPDIFNYNNGVQVTK